MIYYVQDYGAVGNGIHNDSAQIQAAIDACHDAGGGRVVLSKDHIYRSGTIFLRSNVDFHIEEGAELVASDQISDFDAFSYGTADFQNITTPTYENCEYQGRPTLFFLYAKDEENITLSGKGKIDGNEEIFYGEITHWHIDGSFYPRVPLMYFEHVNNLTIKDLTLCRSAFWTVHPIGCTNVTISDLFINNNLKLANCDGIDPDHCKNVRISGCHIVSADDCIVFKNTSHGEVYGACENILVENCDLMSTSAAIKFGTESEAAFRNIVVRNCQIKDSNRGISLQLRDNGYIDDVHFENITIDCRMFSKQHWWGDGEPIAITAVKRKSDTDIGYIKNVSFENISCTAENGILIYGDSSKNISNISFKDINLNLKNKTGEIRITRDLRPCDDTPSVCSTPSCLYIRYADNVSFESLNLSVEDSMSDQFSPYVIIEESDSVNVDWKMIEN